MSSETALTNDVDPEKGLPPVQAPSGRFIVQLFLVPGLIVTVAVLLLLGFSWLVGGESTPDKLLERLESPNAEVRWRAASEFAQRLKRDDALASNPRVALRLTTLLHKSVEELDRMTADAAQADAKKSLREKRQDIEYLAPCVGSLSVPTGAGVLSDIARTGRSHDLKTRVLLRRKAVWALADLGNNVKRFNKLPSTEQEAILNELQSVSLGSGEQAEWASLAYRFLKGTQTNIGVIPVLAESAKAEDPFLRELVALALTFWEGEGDDKALAERTLHALSYDDGHGTRVGIGESD